MFLDFSQNYKLLKRNSTPSLKEIDKVHLNNDEQE
jgi:hypothetical protein